MMAIKFFLYAKNITLNVLQRTCTTSVIRKKSVRIFNQLSKNHFTKYKF